MFWHLSNPMNNGNQDEEALKIFAVFMKVLFDLIYLWQKLLKIWKKIYAFL
jgi:hypothetical protein